MMVPAALPQTVTASSVQTTSAPRARLALGFDTFQIRLPYPRFYVVPGPQEVTTQTQYYTQQAAPFAATAMAAPPVPVGQSFGVAAAAAPAQLAIPSQAVIAQPPMQVALPAQSVTAQPQPLLAQPQVQVAVPSQAVVAQPQMAVPVNVSPTTAQVLAFPSNACDPAQAARAQATKQQLDELSKQVQSLEKMLSPQATPQREKTPCDKP
jgi:hypothetical protein